MLILCHSKGRLIEVFVKGLNALFHKGFLDFNNFLVKRLSAKINVNILTWRQNIDIGIESYFQFTNASPWSEFLVYNTDFTRIYSCCLISYLFIFSCRVVLFKPSNSAAPPAPPSRQFVDLSTSTIWSRSISLSFILLAVDEMDDPGISTFRISFSDIMIAFSIVFCSSLMLPGLYYQPVPHRKSYWEFTGLPPADQIPG